MNWELNTNPSATQAEVYRSTDNSSFTNVFSGAAQSFTDTELYACSTYYFKVRNLNGGGVPTAYAGPVQLFTTDFAPQPASGLSAESLAGRRIALSWTPSVSGDVVQYRVYFDSGTGSVDYSVPLTVLTSTVTAYTTGVLVSSPGYTFALRAVNACGIEERNTRLVASAQAVQTLSGIKAAIKDPHSGKKISGNRVTVIAEIILGEPFQVSSVLFQYKASTSSEWAAIIPANVNHSNPDASAPYFVHWDVSALPTADYDLRAVVSDIYGNTDTSPQSITIAVDNLDFDIKETELGDGTVKKEQLINNTVTSVVQSADADNSWVTKVSISSGSVSVTTVTIAVVNNPSALPPLPADLNHAGQSVEITLSNAQTLLSGGKTAEIVLSYPDADDNGVVDGTSVRADRLILYSYDPVSLSWKRDLDSRVDLARRLIFGYTRHFSYFAAFAPAASDLDAITVYPNPFKPNGPNPDEGVPYSAGNPDSGIVFNNVTAAVTIKIYTVSGQLVRTLRSAGSSGKVQWDAKNGDGRDAASGVYLAVISGPGNATVVRKILVLR